MNDCGKSFKYVCSRKELLLCGNSMNMYIWHHMTDCTHSVTLSTLIRFLLKLHLFLSILAFQQILRRNACVTFIQTFQHPYLIVHTLKTSCVDCMNTAGCWFKEKAHWKYCQYLLTLMGSNPHAVFSSVKHFWGIFLQLLPCNDSQGLSSWKTEEIKSSLYYYCNTHTISGPPRTYNRFHTTHKLTVMS